MFVVSPKITICHAPFSFVLFQTCGRSNIWKKIKINVARIFCLILDVWKGPLNGCVCLDVWTALNVVSNSWVLLCRHLI